MEHLEYKFDNCRGGASPTLTYCICGVVASGNLEVMMEHRPSADCCVFTIDTAASGFSASWDAVIRDFMERNSASDLYVSINDNAASPAVVSLRLDQAFEVLCGRK